MRKLSPQQRVIERWRAEFGEHGWDIEGYAQQNHFDNLDDEEWAAVWRHVASKNETVDESRVRFLVDDAAYSSGWFVGFKVYSGLTQAELKEWMDEKHAFLSQTRQYIDSAIRFFGEPDNDPTEPYDPWPERRILPHLTRLADRLNRDIDRDKRALNEMPPDLPNSAQPELDLWRARLMVVWSQTCGLSTKNSMALRGFLLDALRPYMPRAELTDRVGEYFIKRWNEGKIGAPETSLLAELHNERANKLEKS